ncbi:NfeD family protein [Ideonella livida]|uniref:NfeD family protein n=1 Tax=Ideonella livida TaxID=2707176 RepID=A0A7C9PGD1_9BURK|nr:NfeD family protein [Ideonella livida]NDY91213.1 NfeD family protein [Ideonella livida]
MFDLSIGAAWWVAAGLLVTLELLTGTFYLLMLALGASAAALLALAGASATLQFVGAALVGGGATVAWHLRRGRRHEVPAAADPAVLLDLGARVVVEHWSPDGRARVHYRGAAWDAVCAPGVACCPGWHHVVSIQGSQLILKPQQDTAVASDRAGAADAAHP